jgi:protein arginine N-methyltransferase 5
MRLRIGPWILLQDVEPIPSANEAYIGEDGSFDWRPTREEYPALNEKGSPSKNPQKKKYPFEHLEYIRHIQGKQPPRTAIEKYGAGYQDYLQVPLQPLTDNLESVTYEVFEKDPVKYQLYEEAVRKALRDWKDSNKPTSGPDGKVVIAVAGAGRGPLVTRALQASEAEGVAIEMWAVEKNPNAYVLLQRHNQTTWNGKVTVVHSDMRSWRGPYRSDTTYLHSPASAMATSEGGDNSPPVSVPTPGHGPIDILISELLGSFADNELSPECLDGILHLLSPQGISIPQSYTAFMTPIAAPKLHADILGRTVWDANAPETPAVVWLHAIDYLSTAAPLSPQNGATDTDVDAKNARSSSSTPADIPHVLPVWSFHHGPMKEQPPSPVSNAHNERFARLKFRVRDRGVCHGFGGYFESVLYPGVELSTHPTTMDQKSENMISWFPIFFPLKVAIPFLSSLWCGTKGHDTRFCSQVA